MTESTDTYADLPALGDAKAERLLNLMLLLRSSKRGFTRAEIFDRVAGYAQDNPATANTMFERDKAELIEAGVKLDGYQADAYSQDEWRYFLSDDEALLPRLDFTFAEAKAVSAALAIWRQGLLGKDALSAKLKLEGVGEALTDSEVAADVRVQPNLDLILEAIADRRVITFDYLKPGKATTDNRRLQPWGAFLRNGQWFVFGLDEERGAERLFNLARIVGKARTVGLAEAFEPPDRIDTENLFRSDFNAESAVQVRLQLAEGKGRYWRRLAGTPEALSMAAGVYEVELLSVPYAVPRLAADAPGVVVLSPPEIREQVGSFIRGEA